MQTISALLALCAGNSTVTDEFPAQRPVTRSFDIILDLHLNKQLSKQSWGGWFSLSLLKFWFKQWSGRMLYTTASKHLQKFQIDPMYTA